MIRMTTIGDSIFVVKGVPEGNGWVIEFSIIDNFFFVWRDANRMHAGEIPDMICDDLLVAIRTVIEYDPTILQ